MDLDQDNRRTPAENHVGRRVLLVSHGYWPWARAHAERMLALSWALVKRGHDVHVLTAHRHDVHLFDDDDPALLPPVTVHRVSDGTSLPLGRLRMQLPDLMLNLFSLLVGYPDRYRLWAERIVHYCAHRAADLDPALVVSSSSPGSAHVAGHKLQRLFGCPWVADFRDQWLGNPMRTEWRGWRVLSERRWYRRTLEQADLLTTVNDQIADLLRRHRVERGLSSNESRVEVFPNGYWERWFRGAQPELPAAVGRRRLALYAGVTYGRYGWDLLCDLARALEEVAPGAWCVGLAGGTGLGDPLPPVCAAGPVWLGFVSPKKLPSYLLSADVLIIVARPNEVPGGGTYLKSYPYMRSGRPVVSFGPEHLRWKPLDRVCPVAYFRPSHTLDAAQYLVTTDLAPIEDMSRVRAQSEEYSFEKTMNGFAQSLSLVGRRHRA
ncbi:MAG: glycosyltransferase [bacterium]